MSNRKSITKVACCAIKVSWCTNGDKQFVKLYPVIRVLPQGGGRFLLTDGENETIVDLESIDGISVDGTVYTSVDISADDFEALLDEFVCCEAGADSGTEPTEEEPKIIHVSTMCLCVAE